jgi:hypothetical protein
LGASLSRLLKCEFNSRTKTSGKKGAFAAG